MKKILFTLLILLTISTSFAQQVIRLPVDQQTACQNILLALETADQRGNASEVSQLRTQYRTDNCEGIFLKSQYTTPSWKPEAGLAYNYPLCVQIDVEIKFQNASEKPNDQWIDELQDQAVKYNCLKVIDRTNKLLGN